MVGAEHEKTGAVRKLSRLFAVGASISVPHLTVVVRKAYGLGAMAMQGGRSATKSRPKLRGPCGLRGTPSDGPRFLYHALIMVRAVLALCCVRRAVSPNGLHVSWPSAESGPMNIEGAVALGFAKELAKAAEAGGDDAAAALFAKLVGAGYARGSALSVARTLETDEVIDPAESRELGSWGCANIGFLHKFKNLLKSQNILA